MSKWIITENIPYPLICESIINYFDILYILWQKGKKKKEGLSSMYDVATF